MKIMRVTPVLYPYEIGGSAIHCHELSNIQSKEKNNVTVLTINRGEKIEEATMNYNLKVFNWYKMPWDFFKMENPFSLRLNLELLRSEYDILHCHSHLFFTSLFAIIISKIKNKPCVITVHGVKAKRNQFTNIMQEIWLEIFSRLIFNLVNKIICLTTADAEEIKKYGAKDEKITIIPNGINTNLFSLSLSHKDSILWVGRFVEEKGLKYLIEAMEYVIKDFPNKRVILIGDGPLRSQIKELVISKKIDHFFEFKEKTSQKEIATAMKECELFVLPSLKEGFPKSILEAMSCGKPIIVTKQLKEIVGDLGFIVTPASVQELKNAINEILSHPIEAKNLGLKSRKLVEQQWSWDVVSKQIEKIYFDLLS